MGRLIRMVLALAFALTGLVLVFDAPAFACKCRPGDLTQQVEQADLVFIATVDKVATRQSTYFFDVTATHSYKGTVERETQVVTAKDESACGIGKLSTGTAYLFLVNGATHRATSCGGSGSVEPERIAKLKALVGEGTPIDAPEPPTATLSRAEDSPPMPLARLAAPGAVLILVGLLGLGVTARLSRRNQP